MYGRKAFLSYILEKSDYTYAFKVFKNGPSKICGRHSSSFTWSILEYLDPYIHLKLFSIIEVKKCFAYIYGARNPNSL